MTPNLKNQKAHTGSGNYHHGDLKLALEDVALEIIDETGFDAISFRGLARRLGVSEAAPYHHFSSKTELLASVAEKGYRGLHRRMIDGMESAGDDPFARLAALGRSYVDYAIENSGRFRLMFGEHMLELGEFENVRAAGSPTRELLTEAVADCVPADAHNATHVENALWSLVHGLAWLLIENEIRPGELSSRDELIDRSINLMIAGIRARAQ